MDDSDPVVRTARPEHVVVSAKSAARREQIAAAASRYIIEHGFEKLSVNDLAEAIGMSVGGMYRYIRTKGDLLVMVCEGIYDGVREALGAVAADSRPIEEKLAAPVDLYLQECQKKRPQLAMM